MFCAGRSCVLLRRQDGPQVLGADVPSFERFPFKARDVLYLYRDFLRLLYRYPPLERPDLLFRLRNEFRSKRHLAGSRAVMAALRRGEGILDTQRMILDARAVAASGLLPRSGGAQCSDAVFDRLQGIAGHVLPDLKNYRQSVTLQGDRVSGSASRGVLSAARPRRKPQLATGR